MPSLNKNVVFENCKIYYATVEEFQKAECTQMIFQFSITEITDQDIIIVLVTCGEKKDYSFTSVFKLGPETQKLKVNSFLSLGNHILSKAKIEELLNDGTGTARTDLQYITFSPLYESNGVKWVFECSAYFADPANPEQPRKGNVAVRTDPSPPAPPYGTTEELLKFTVQ